MASSDANIITARQLLRRHRSPEFAFTPHDAKRNGLVDLKSARQVLQGLTGVTLNPVEITALARKYGGDGKTFNYRRFLAEQHLQHDPRIVAPLISSRAEAASAVAARSVAAVLEPPASTPRRQRVGEAELGRSVPTYMSMPGIDKQRDVEKLASADTRLLQFSSDSLTLAPKVNGTSAAPLVATISARGSMRPPHKMDVEQRGREYGLDQAPIQGSDLSVLHEHHASRLDESRNFSTAEGGGASQKLFDPFYHTGKIERNLGTFMNDSTIVEPPGPEYLPVFPGDDYARLRPRDAKLLHNGPVASTGGLAGFVTDESWHTDVPRGYVAPLPNGFDTETPKLAVIDPIYHHGVLLEQGGIAGWNNDTAGYFGELEANKWLHDDPLHHTGVIKDKGGLEGLAAEETSWLQNIPTGAKQHTHNPRRFPRSVSASRDGSMRGSGTARRRSVPDLAVATPTKAALYQEGSGKPSVDDGSADLDWAGSPTLAQFVTGAMGDTEVGGRAPGDMTGDARPVSGIARWEHGMHVSQLNDMLPPGAEPPLRMQLQRTSDVAGPITDVYGLHHKHLSYAFGARSPVAVALAASPMARFDVQKLAQVRAAMRERLPEKPAAAAALLRHRLAHLDGDKDGHVTESELMAGLASVFPDMDAASTGMLVKYFRHKRAQRSRADVAERANSSAADGAPGGDGVGTAARDSRDSSTTVPVVLDPQHAESRLLKTRDVASLLTGGPSKADSEEVKAGSVSTAAYGAGIAVTEITDWILKQTGGLQEMLSPMQIRGLGTIPGWDSPEGKRVVPGPGEPGSAKATQHRGSPPKSSLVSTDSGAVAVALFDVTTSTQRGGGLPDDFRDAGKPFAQHASVANDDPASMLTSFTLGTGSAAGKAKTSSYTEMHRRRAHHAQSGEFRRGDGEAPAAGVSLTARRKKDTGEDEEEGGDRTQWAVRNAKFETFKAQWEVRHGAPAAKELASDAALGPEGPTWTRAQPAPFRVLHVSGGAPPPHH